jgi:hypothetical protein
LAHLNFYYEPRFDTTCNGPNCNNRVIIVEVVSQECVTWSVRQNVELEMRMAEKSELTLEYVHLRRREGERERERERRLEYVA